MVARVTAKHEIPTSIPSSSELLMSFSFREFPVSIAALEIVIVNIVRMPEAYSQTYVMIKFSLDFQTHDKKNTKDNHNILI